MDTEQEERPKGVRCSESGAKDTVNTHEGEVSEENKADEGCDERVTAVAARPERDGGNSSIWQEPGRPGSPAPKALESGRTNRLKRRSKDSPKTPRVEATIPTRRKQANTAKARLCKPRPGEQKQEKQNVSQSSCFPKSEARHHRWNGNNGLKKERHDRYDSAYDQAQREPVPSHNSQENSQARFFQLDTTPARRNQPVKRRSVLRQAPRGRGKRRPAQAR